MLKKYLSILSRGNVSALTAVFGGIVLIVSVLLIIRDGVTFTSKNQEPSAINVHSIGKTAAKELSGFAPIVEKNAFGLRDLKFTQLLPLKGKNVSANISKYKLMGTIAGDKGTGYAIFEDGGGKQEIFKAGQRVSDGLVLKEVLAKEALFSDGTSIVLSEMPSAQTRETHTGTNALGRKIDSSNYQLDNTKVQQALENPKQLMTEARLQPNLVNGKQAGFIMREVKPGGIYDTLGIKNDDVLLKINSYDITDPEAALQAFTALRGVSEIHLDIIRGGNKMTLNYNIM
ncbi:hypothetical protein [Candidatus Magnetomonas plexicatena]|uniref:hypothetical protein n=1 Tax=Candidatus Magnetomonas plexicatena TaxID=2552947 RepID=UPI001C741DE9|nr:hypothetical protein E2O03_014020 [Nitrospirales bacterium LBB_01]